MFWTDHWTTRRLSSRFRIWIWRCRSTPWVWWGKWVRGSGSILAECCLRTAVFLNSCPWYYYHWSPHFNREKESEWKRLTVFINRIRYISRRSQLSHWYCRQKMFGDGIFKSTFGFFNPQTSAVTSGLFSNINKETSARAGSDDLTPCSYF